VKVKLLRGSIAITGLASMALFISLRIDVTNEITHFLPEGGNRAWASFSTQLSNSYLTRTIIVNLGGAEPEELGRVAGALARAIEHNPGIDSVRRGIDPKTESQFFELFFRRRYCFLSDRPEKELPGRLTEESLAHSAEELKRGLASPLGGLIRRIAEADPLLTFFELMQRLEHTRVGELVSRGEQFFTKDEKFAVVFVTTTHSAFDTGAQRRVLAEIRSAFESIRERHASRVTLELGGISLFALVSEKAIRAAIARISLVSISAIALFFVVVFGSFRYLFLAFLPLIYGLVTAIAVSLLVYGKLHGLTLAFGATLTGVCIDYPIHFFNQLTDDGVRQTPIDALRRIWPALWLGCVTTVLGFVGLAWTSFPGIREIAVFSATSIVTALLITRWLLPGWLPDRPRTTEIQRRMRATLGALLYRLSRRRFVVSIPIGLSVLVCVWGMNRIRWQDDLRALSVVPSKLTQQDRRVRERLSQADASRFVIAVGPDREAALQSNDRVYGLLVAARDAGELKGFSSLHSLLWSKRLQRRNLAVLRASPDLGARMLDALEGAGFNRDKFRPFVSSLESRVEPLAPENLLESKLAGLVQGFLLENESGVGIVTYLRGVRNPVALDRRFREIKDAHFFDQAAFVNKMYTQYRRRTTELIMAGLLLVGLILWIRYRDPRLALASFAPSVLAAAAALSILALSGIPINLLHVMSLLLVLSMGVDYGVFLVESVRNNSALGSTMLSIVMACLFTVLSFGMMATSTQPSLASIGQATGLGVLLALLFTPLSLALLAPIRRS
jgi:predicted exporter